MDLFKNVLLVLSVPAEYSEKEKAIMRKCAYNAKLIDDPNTKFLQFTTERMLNFYLLLFLNFEFKIIIYLFIYFLI